MQFVELKGLSGNADLTCNTTGNAIRALDAIGMCMNYGVVLKRAEKSGPIMVFYEGWLYHQTHERFVELPFPIVPFRFMSDTEVLLRQIFAPFAVKGHQNIFRVYPHPVEANCCMVQLVLFFPMDAYAEIREALTEVEDSHEAGEATYFWLD